MRTIDQILFEDFKEQDVETMYDEMLDELSTVEIGSLTYSASRVLIEVDPTAYRCGYNDYIDSLLRDGYYQTEDEKSIYSPEDYEEALSIQQDEQAEEEEEDEPNE
jgi:hypothetical protein